MSEDKVQVQYGSVKAEKLMSHTKYGRFDALASTSVHWFFNT